MNQDKLPAKVTEQLKNEPIDLVVQTAYYESPARSFLNIVAGIMFASLPIGFILYPTRGSETFPIIALYCFAAFGILLFGYGVYSLLRKGPLAVATTEALYFFTEGSYEREYRIAWKSLMLDIQTQGNFQKGSILLKRRSKAYGNLNVDLSGISDPYEIEYKIRKRIFSGTKGRALKETFTAGQVLSSVLSNQEIDFSTKVGRIRTYWFSVFVTLFGAAFTIFSGLLLTAVVPLIFQSGYGGMRTITPSIFLSCFFAMGLFFFSLGLKDLLARNYHVIGSEQGLTIVRNGELRTIGWQEFKPMVVYDKARNSIKLKASLVQVGTKKHGGIIVEPIDMSNVENSEHVNDSILKRI